PADRHWQGGQRPLTCEFLESTFAGSTRTSSTTSALTSWGQPMTTWIACSPNVTISRCICICTRKRDTSSMPVDSA
ncbi:MAG TPA: hypothetical protein DIT01_00820, partial [Lentisphaeria bacterium]|nr:hypothetical protein [Lentisphaeria bacterium]